MTHPFEPIGAAAYRAMHTIAAARRPGRAKRSSFKIVAIKLKAALKGAHRAKRNAGQGVTRSPEHPQDRSQPESLDSMEDAPSDDDHQNLREAPPTKRPALLGGRAGQSGGLQKEAYAAFGAALAV